MKNTSLFATTVGALALLGITAGCTPGAREDLGQAGENVGQATSKSVEGTAEATAKAGEAVATGAEKAVDATGKAVANAGDAVAEGTAKAVDATGKAVEHGAAAVEKGAAKAADATGKAVEGAAKGAAEAGQAVTLTPKVKNALLVDDKIAGYKLNVDTNAGSDTVTITGTAPSAAEKKRITAVAQKAAGANIKIVNNVTVGGSK